MSKTFISIVAVLGLWGILYLVASDKHDAWNYRDLYREGIVSGFGIRSGNPQKQINRIPAIDEPRYVAVSKASYENSEWCVGMKVGDRWNFASLNTLNGHEIVNDRGRSLCYCPLAGMSLVLEGKHHISGLLKYDTFVLYSLDKRAMVMPFTLSYRPGSGGVKTHPIHLLSFAGVKAKFPGALILDKKRYRYQPGAYGDYERSRSQGIGHPKPGLTESYEPSKEGWHPKTLVMLVGESRFEKGYPLSELQKVMVDGRAQFNDKVNGRVLKISYDHKYKWATSRDEQGRVWTRGFAYIFALKQHLPKLPIYRSGERQ